MKIDKREVISYLQHLIAGIESCDELTDASMDIKCHLDTITDESCGWAAILPQYPRDKTVSFSVTLRHKKGPN